MRFRIGNMLSIGFLALASTAAGNLGGEEQWLQYRSSRQASAFVGGSAWTGIELSSEAPEGAKLPEFEGTIPLFGRWETPMAPAGGILLAIDRSRKRGMYDRLYIDMDGDGDLSAEDQHRAHSVSSHNAEFAQVKILFEGPDGPITYHMNLTVYANQKREVSGLGLRTAGWYEGDVRIGEKTWRCRLVDYNVNGTFDDRSMNFDQIDRIRIGTNDEFRTFFVGNYLEIEGRYYEPRLARDGAWISFTPRARVPLGTVRLSSDVTRISMGGTNGLFAFDVSNRVVRVPAGEYRVNEWVIEREDDKGIPWTATGSGFGSTFAVKAGADVPLEVGEPLVCELSATRREEKYVFEQDVVGRHGERVEFLKRSRRPRAPKLLVKSEDGAFEKVYKFEYG